MAPPIVVLYRSKVNKLVANRKLDLALKELIRFFEFLDLKEETGELIVISYRLSQTESDYSKGILVREGYITEKSAIANSITNFLNRNFSEDEA